MANTYDVGDRVKIQGSFTDANGTAADPTAVAVKVRDPSGNVSTYTYALSQVTKQETGVYYMYVTIDEAGEWWYRFEGTGAVIAADEMHFWAPVARVVSSS